MRGLQILEALAGMRQPAPLAEVAQRCSLSDSQAFRVLRQLEEASFVTHLPRRGYRLGHRSAALGALIAPRPVLVRSVQPVLARLASVARATVVLHMRSGNYRVLVLRVAAAAGPGVPVAFLGERSPLPVGASGRVILAALPDSEVRLIDASEAVAERVENIRRSGYEMSFSENHAGVNGISAALLSVDGAPLGSLTIAGGDAQLTAEKMLELSPPLLRACADIGPLVASLLGPDPGATIAALDL
jgi:IclR family transcriptional regulator, acetate operon repressor